MPPGGSRPGGRSSMASGLAQTKTPEFPPALKRRHSTASSRFVKVVKGRMTPTGLPVQRTPSVVQVQVSGAQLTLVKSPEESVRQPRPCPSMNALGDVVTGSAADG